MISKLVNLSAILCLLVLVSCATGGRKAHLELKKDLAKHDVKAAIALVESDRFYPEERNKLLKLLELGNLKYIEGSYYQALKTFDKARELSDKLFTVSMSKKAAAALANSNADNYYGEIYERSLIRFYQALNHYLIYQKGSYEAFMKKTKAKDGTIKVVAVEEKKLNANQKKNHLSGARAVLLEWDSLLNNYHSTMSGKSTYKFDLASRLFGAYIHEQMGTSSDKRIALKLYKDAKKVLFRNYNLYPAFNSKAKKFRSDYKKLPRMSKKKVKANYVGETAYAKNLLAYIDMRYKALKSGKKDNVTFVIQQGFVSEKKANKIDFKIPVASLPNIGGIVGFTTKLLKASANSLPSITFELPEVAEKKLTNKMSVVVKDASGKVVKKANAVVVNPISDIAYQTLDNKMISTYAKIGARVAGKHIVAIAAAYAIAKKTPGLAGDLMAGAMYAGANKGIAASEAADLRFWSTLPHTLRMSSMSLKPGTYSVSFTLTNGKGSKSVDYGKFTVEAKKQKLVNLNVF